MSCLVQVQDTDIDYVVCYKINKEKLLCIQSMDTDHRP